jgi:hypothetical protein
MLVELDRSLEPGATIQLSLTWPGIYHTCDKVRLDVMGEVLRNHGTLAAVRMLKHVFRVPRPWQPTAKRWAAPRYLPRSDGLRPATYRAPRIRWLNVSY